jgi:hypothetical protein
MTQVDRPTTGSPPDELEILIDRYTATRLAPSVDQLARGRVTILTAVTPPRSVPVAPRPFLRGWSLAAAFALLLIASASVVAAESGPGQPFYGLRLAIGSAFLSGEEPAHERGLAAQLDDRLAEVRAAARDGDGAGAQAAIHEYLNTLSQLTRTAITDPAILALLQRHQDTLQDLLSVAPAQATGGVQEALDAAGKVHGVAPPGDSTVPHPTPGAGAGESPPGMQKP